MNSEHIISLIRSNCNNIDDLKKILSAVECSIEAIEEETPEPQPLPTNLKQVKQMHQANLDAANGTSLKGYIMTTYKRLVEIFGIPQVNSGPSKFDKVTIEWVLRFADGTIATIYDWKGYGWQPAEDEQYEWRIGGHKPEAVALVKDAVGVMYGTGPFFQV
jgi:ribosomal protein S10